MHQHQVNNLFYLQVVVAFFESLLFRQIGDGRLVVVVQMFLYLLLELLVVMVDDGSLEELSGGQADEEEHLVHRVYLL